MIAGSAPGVTRRHRCQALRADGRRVLRAGGRRAEDRPGRRAGIAGAAGRRIAGAADQGRRRERGTTGGSMGPWTRGGTATGTGRFATGTATGGPPITGPLGAEGRRVTRPRVAPGRGEVRPVLRPRARRPSTNAARRTVVVRPRAPWRWAPPDAWETRVRRPAPAGCADTGHAHGRPGAGTGTLGRAPGGRSVVPRCGGGMRERAHHRMHGDDRAGRAEHGRERSRERLERPELDRRRSGPRASGARGAATHGGGADEQSP